MTFPAVGAEDCPESAVTPGGHGGEGHLILQAHMLAHPPADVLEETVGVADACRSCYQVWIGVPLRHLILKCSGTEDLKGSRNQTQLLLHRIYLFPEYKWHLPILNIMLFTLIQYL